MDWTPKQLRQLEAKIELKKRDTIESFYEFLKYFWDVIIQDDFVDNWHIKYLCDELQNMSTFIVNREPKPYDLIINIPPGSSKSTITTVMFPVWMWLKDPSISTLTSSFSASLSTDRSIKSRDIVKSEKWDLLYGDYFKEAFGENLTLKKDRDNKTNWANNYNGERMVTSTGGAATGRHAHLILVDDPLNPEQALSDVERVKANRFVDQTLSTRKKDKEKTPTILIKQRLHEEDPTGNWLKKGKSIKHICLPAEDSIHVKPAELRSRYIDGYLDPVRLNRTVLDEARKDLGSYGYAGQYDQIPAPAEGGMIKRNWFQIISRDEFEHKYNAQKPIVNYFVDTAYTKNVKNDASGIIACCLIEKDLYVFKGKKMHVEFPELKRQLPIFCKQNKYDARSRVRIEPKANGLSVVQELQAIKEINVLTTKTPKDSKTTRLIASSATIEMGRVFVVDDVWTDDFITEVCSFPNAKEDEYVDILSYAVDFYFLNKKTLKVYS